MGPALMEQKLLPPFTPNQHRRRVSLPTTPPETPMDGYFGADARKQPASNTRGTIVYPLTPPQTPTKVLSEKDQVLPPPSGHRRRPSYAYAHHRRTSTATLLRLAAARQGIILTPSKAITLFLIFLSATWLASYLPSPFALILPRHSSLSHASGHYIMPTYVHNNMPSTSHIGDAAQRRAWQDSFPYRIPPQQHVVPTNDAADPAVSSLDGDVMRAHPELLSNGGRPARRRPLRIQPDPHADSIAPPPPPRIRPTADTSFDDASRSPRRPAHNEKGRQAQLNRMKKVAVAKGQNARIGRIVPVDSTQQQAAARAEQERVIVDAGSSGRRKLHNPKGVEAAYAAAAGKQERAMQKAMRQGSQHAPAVVEVEKEEKEGLEKTPVVVSSSAIVDEDGVASEGGPDEADDVQTAENRKSAHRPTELARDLSSALLISSTSAHSSPAICFADCNSRPPVSPLLFPVINEPLPAMSSLRKHQGRAMWKEPTKEDLFREAFGLPDDENPLGDVHAMLMMSGREEAYSGKLYLSTSFLTFTSLDRRSCRLTLPLATIRRVEKLAPGQEGTAAGAFALALTLFHGLRIVVQLNSLRPTNDQFCANLRVRLKAALPLMKSLKPFANTFFSEWFLSPEREQEEMYKKADDAKVGELISFDDKGKGREVDDDEPWNTEWGIDAGFHAGLGMIFKFPGDPRKLREKSKMKLWKEYLKHHGRNLTLLRYPSFTRLVLVGLPNRLRGEMWELTCGSMFLRLHNPGVYHQILKDNEGRRSASTDDIEKDLHRSLPEYSAYQDPKGIDTMRRVLTAYAWSNPALGYCQAMNLVTASFLIYMSEEQCFWCLTVLCDRMLPGYYSPSMYGTVLDQRVFEHLVQRCLPTLHEHFVQADIQLSVASLPWFLSLYISSMPMVFAFRIIDCFFLMGPKVLFQVGLAILKLNGHELMQTTDDGAFINVLKAYFTTLGDSAHPRSHDPRQRQITKFQELFVVAFREFSIISDDTIASERKRFRSEVLVSIETFAKRTAIRNLQSTRRLNKDQLGLAYDHFQLAVLKQKERERAAASIAPRSRSSSINIAANGSPRSPGLRSPALSTKPSDASSGSSGSKVPKEETRPEDRIDRAAFGEFIADVATWARDEKVVKNGLLEHVERTPKNHAFIDKIFALWDSSLSGSLSFQDIVDGLDGVLYNEIVANVAWLFTLYDSNRDGYLTKDEILQVSEALLFIFRNEPGDRYLGSISNLLQNLFEFAESTKPDLPPADPSNPDSELLQPFLSLATFRMCILTDSLLESFFESDLTESWRLEVLVPPEPPKPKTAAAGWWGNIVNAVVTEENKERFNRIADEVGKRLDIQTIEQRPSIGKLDAAAAAIEPTARENLFSTSTSRKPKSLPPLTNSEPVNPLSAAAMRMPAYPQADDDNPWADVRASLPSPASREHDIDVQALARQAMQRPQFAADEAKEGEGEDLGAEADEGLLGQVDAMLEADEAATPGLATQSGKDLL
ncbi:hypothetical protein JCM11251_000520 [Rhodosporidiobolus azoricus]